jgi:L-lactate dehydrogenase complex protein LldG
MQSLKTSKAKETILSKIRKGLSEKKMPIPFPEIEKDNREIYALSEMDSIELFATEFIKLGGKFVFCEDEMDLIQQIVSIKNQAGWNDVLCSEKSITELFVINGYNFVSEANVDNSTADACITFVETLVARTGSALLSSKQNLGRIASVFYPVHIMVAYANQVVKDIDAAMGFIQKKYSKDLPSMINLNTGPSRTADIEKTLVVGVHGPREVFCFLVNQ